MLGCIREVRLLRMPSATQASDFIYLLWTGYDARPGRTTDQVTTMSTCPDNRCELSSALVSSCVCSYALWSIVTSAVSSMRGVHMVHMEIFRS